MIFTITYDGCMPISVSACVLETSQCNFVLHHTLGVFTVTGIIEDVIFSSPGLTLLFMISHAL
jgi:hypothetical protein